MSDIAALESSAKLWEWVDYIGLFLVLVGVIGESIVEFTDRIKSAFLKPKIGKVSALVLIVGLSLELISLPKLSAINGRIVAMLNTQAAEAQRAADEARQRAAEAQTQTAQALQEQERLRKQNLELSLQVEKERLARVKIEERLAPRRLTPDQQSQLLHTLRANPKGNIDLFCTSGAGSEPCDFAAEIASILKTAGWTVNKIEEGLIMKNKEGLFLKVHSAESAPEYAGLLQNALTAIGFPTGAQEDQNRPEHSLQLLINTKP
jgi:hypothetical protein